MALSNSSIQEMNQYLNSTYYVPDYQREYSWESEQLDDFWTDLNDSCDGSVVDHFLVRLLFIKMYLMGKKDILSTVSKEQRQQ